MYLCIWNCYICSIKVFNIIQCLRTKCLQAFLVQVAVQGFKQRGADKSLARSTCRCILFDDENISFGASLVIYINSTNILPIMIINRIYEHQNLLSLQLVSFLVGLRTYQYPCIKSLCIQKGKLRLCQFMRSSSRRGISYQILTHIHTAVCMCVSI